MRIFKLLSATLILLALARGDDWGSMVVSMDVPQFPPEVLSVRADGHVEAYFQIHQGRVVNATLVGPTVSPALTTFRSAALSNMETWRFRSNEVDSARLLAKFDYALPEKCGLPWSAAFDSAGEIRITPELPCSQQIKQRRVILHFDDLLYPPIAKVARIEGLVKSEITIDDNGAVTDVKVLEAHPIFRQATIENLKRLHFAPVANPQNTTITFYLQYRLSDGNGPSWGIVLHPDGLELSAPPPTIDTSVSY